MHSHDSCLCALLTRYGTHCVLEQTLICVQTHINQAWQNCKYSNAPDDTSAKLNSRQKSLSMQISSACQHAGTQVNTANNME